MQRTLIIMVKEPRPGRVKTRLAKGLGMVGAAWWYRHQVQGLIGRLRNPRWRIVLAVSPDRAGLASRVWPQDLPRMPQGSGNLGDRMTRLLNAPIGPVCLIGSDIPEITPGHIARGFAALGRAEFVFGPALDGGFWLVGSKRVPMGMFANVRWSTEHALADSLASLGNRRVALVDVLRDVDTMGDLAHSV